MHWVFEAGQVVLIAVGLDVGLVNALGFGISQFLKLL